MNPIGHESNLHYLREGLRSDRLSPSLLFVGPDGVGKRTVALEIAKCFACVNPPASSSAGLPRCDACSGCARVDALGHPDILFIDRALQASLLREKPEGQTAIKIESVRHLDKFLRLSPMESRRRVAIVDEAHKMTVEAANALLKILEEPPAKAQIVLLAVEERSLPTTVLSRCAILRFRPIPAAPLAQWLARTHGFEPDAAAELAERAGGSFAAALRLKDQSTDTVDISDYELDEFFRMLGESHWRKEGRKRAELVLTHLIEQSRKKLSGGDLTQVERLNVLLAARRQVDRNVPPRLVLENVYLTLRSR